MNQQGVIGGSTGPASRFGSDLGAPCARLFFTQGSVSGPWALDLRYRPHFRHILDQQSRLWELDFAIFTHFQYFFRILGWDPGRWIRRQLHTFDTFSEFNRIGSHRICDTDHIFHTICIHILDLGLGPCALDFSTFIHFSHTGLWIWCSDITFPTVGLYTIASDASQ